MQVYAATWNGYHAIARLQDGTTVAQADARVHAAVAALAARYPSTNQEKTGGVEAYFPAGARMRAQLSGARLMVLGMSATVLLVVGLNISGMMLVRSAMRQRELAVRAAMGAARWRLMRYHLSEALVMALLGGTLASAILFGGPIVIARVFDTLEPRARFLRAGPVAGAAVHRPLPRHERGARRAAGAALQSAVHHHRAEERLRRKRPARRPPSALHRGGASGARRAVPRDLRRVSRSSASHDVCRRRLHAAWAVRRTLSTPGHRQDAPRNSACSSAACSTIWPAPLASHPSVWRTASRWTSSIATCVSRETAKVRSSPPTRRESGPGIWRRSARVCSPDAPSMPTMAPAPSASCCCRNRLRVSSSRPATRRRSRRLCDRR